MFQRSDKNVNHSELETKEDPILEERKEGNGASYSPASVAARELRITTTTPSHALHSKSAVLMDEHPFKSDELKALWLYAKLNSKAAASQAARLDIIKDIKTRYVLQCEGRATNDDGIARSFDHIFNDATLNMAIVLMRYDSLTEAERLNSKAANASAPWLIHYKTELSKVMHDSAKHLKNIQFSKSNSGTKYNFGADRIIHIQNPQIQENIYDERMGVRDLKTFKDQHKNFFNKQKRSIEGLKSRMTLLDEKGNVSIMVCVGFNEPLGGEALQNDIDYYLLLFKFQYEMQVEQNNEDIRLYEEATDKSEADDLRLQALKDKKFVQLTAANITIYLMPFDGVNVPLNRVDEAATETMDSWTKENVTALQAKYQGINLVPFSEFQKTAYYQMAYYFMQVYLIAKKGEIISQKLFEKDIAVYLTKLSDDTSISLVKTPQSKIVKSLSQPDTWHHGFDFKNESHDSRSPRPSPSTGTPSVANSLTPLSMPSGFSSPESLIPLSATGSVVSELGELKLGQDAEVRTIEDERQSRSALIYIDPRSRSKSQSPTRTSVMQNNDPLLTNLFQFVADNPLGDEGTDRLVVFAEKHIQSQGQSYYTTNNTHFNRGGTRSLPSSPERVNERVNGSDANHSATVSSARRKLW